SDPRRADELVSTARDSALESSDAIALHRIATYEYEYADGVGPYDRADTARRLAQFARRAGLLEVLIDAHSYLGTALLESGDVEGARVEWAEHERLASRLQSPAHLAVDGQRRAMWAAMAGRFAAAEHHVQEMVMLMPDDPAYIGVYGAQVVALRILAGRLQEALDLVDLAVEHAELPLARATRAALLARLGRREEAETVLATVATSGWTALRRDMMWKVTLAEAATAAALLEDRDRQAALYRLLLPVADELVVFAHGAMCWGSVHRFLGPLAERLGRVDEAGAHRRAALAAHRRLGATLFIPTSPAPGG
ncbi:MAG TPA: hypothetical protein VF855_09010, partial [Acidimicrobiales bacterium]